MNSRNSAELSGINKEISTLYGTKRLTDDVFDQLQSLRHRKKELTTRVLTHYLEKLSEHINGISGAEVSSKNLSKRLNELNDVFPDENEPTDGDVIYMQAISQLVESLKEVQKLLIYLYLSDLGAPSQHNLAAELGVAQATIHRFKKDGQALFDKDV